MNFPGAIAVVDDEAHLRNSVALVLRRLGSPKIIGATNGEEGVAANRRENPDLVHLDVNIPIRDGIETLKYRPLRCDGLQKVLFGLTTIEPIDQNTSFEWATGCLVRGPHPSARVHPPPHRRVARSSFSGKLHPILEPMTESRAIDPQAIENLRSLNPDDHDEFLREIAGIFMEDTPRRIAELEQSLAAADLPKFTRAAHSIKGSSANLGAMALGAVAERLEQHARTHGVHAAAPFVAELTAEFARARAELTKLITP